MQNATFSNLLAGLTSSLPQSGQLTIQEHFLKTLFENITPTKNKRICCLTQATTNQSPTPKKQTRYGIRT
jgi:hypothetical protein